MTIKYFSVNKVHNYMDVLGLLYKCSNMLYSLYDMLYVYESWTDISMSYNNWIDDYLYEILL